MQRRKFISLSAVGCAAIGFTGINCNHTRPAFYNVLDKPHQLSYILDTKTIRDMGMSYRLQIPAENEADKLVELLSVDTAGKTVSSSGQNILAETVIEQKIVRDFETGSTVFADGFTGGGWHPMGTTRMSDDPKQGVVDADCKVHGISNLYMAGASCYVTAGSPNPTLTLVALTPAFRSYKR